MQGLKVWHGKDSGNCCFELVLASEKDKAEQYRKRMLEVFSQDKFQNSGIEEIEINKCHCGKLMFADMRECLRCEDLRSEAENDFREEKKEAE